MASGVELCCVLLAWCCIKKIQHHDRASMVRITRGTGLSGKDPPYFLEDLRACSKLLSIRALKFFSKLSVINPVKLNRVV